ncbi:folylpolyglutamate synthase, mitochondrial isoform X1 [Callorhinchus milii]|nr:folylpolyglutamate synthase, mitochondrial isoform X1 [Callorhinchus milii]
MARWCRALLQGLLGRRLVSAAPPGAACSRLSAFTPWSAASAPRAGGMDYSDAVWALNSLQTNASVLENVRRDQARGQSEDTLKAMKSFLERTGLTVEQLDQLSVIHVTGTKGKGSTCAFCEKILHNYGLKTGFFSSPHLVQVRERIRINGQPISKELFAKYFWQVYTLLDQTKGEHADSLPAYFHFLTILMFHIFLREKVQVAIVEVGIGGAFDCTNIIRRPVVCGVSSLGLDHVAILGDSLEKIAWHKGGIFKPAVPAFTVTQFSGPMGVLVQRAKEIGCLLRLCPDLGDYPVEGGKLHLGLVGEHQKHNATLALQLVQTWLRHHDLPSLRGSMLPPGEYEHGRPPASSGFPLPAPMVQGLQDTVWLGRSQVMKRGPVTYYIDGAHTIESMQAGVRWYREYSLREAKAVDGRLLQVLLFNTTGERDAQALLKLLLPCQFDFAVFCPNLTMATQSMSDDQTNYTVSLENVLTNCLTNQQTWCQLLQGGREESWRASGDRLAESVRLVKGGGRDRGLLLLRESEGSELDQPEARALVFPCISDALQWITQGRDPELGLGAAGSPTLHSAGARALQEASAIQILIIGSLHLIGGALKLLDQSLSE